MDKTNNPQQKIHQNKGRISLLNNQLSDNNFEINSINKDQELILSIIDNMPGIFYIFNKKGNLLKWNNNLKTVTGYTDDELIRKKPLYFFEDKYKALIWEKLKQVFAEGFSETEAQITTKNGDHIWYYLKAKRIESNGEYYFLGNGIDINKSKKIEDKLIFKSERLNRILDASNTGIWEWDILTNTFYFSHRWKQQLGYNNHELPNVFDTWTQNIHPEDKEDILNKINEFIEFPAGDFKHEYRMKHKDGSYRWIQNRSSATLNHLGKAVRISGSHLDITQQKNDQQKIEQSRANLQMILDTLPFGTMIIDKNKIIKQINKTGLKITKFKSGEELVGEKCFNTVCPANCNKCPILDLNKDIENSKKFIRTKTGEKIQVIKTVLPIVIDEEEVLLETFIDITEQEELKKSILKSEENFRQIFDSVNESIIIINLDGKIIEVNKSAFKNFGFTKDQFPTLSFKKIIAKEYQHLFVKFLEELKTKRSFNTEAEVLRKDGSTFFGQIRGSLVTYNGTPHIRTSINDITERKKYEQDLQSTLNDLENSNTELEQFAYVSSHDLQEPLRKIKNYTELLEYRYKGQLDEKAQIYISIITRGATRMQKLINDLLTISRISTRGNTFEMVPIKKAVDDVIEMYDLKIYQENVSIVCNKLPTLNVDEKQIIQLFQNLISNAIKFKDKADPVIEIDAVEKKDHWQFSITDNGIGFDMQFANRIFTVFQRLHTREEYSGTGIGLAICKKIIERHNGKIWAESTPGFSSTFYFTLPK